MVVIFRFHRCREKIIVQINNYGGLHFRLLILYILRLKKLKYKKNAMKEWLISIRFAFRDRLLGRK